MPGAADDHAHALRSFIDDNEDLERLETLLDQFNLFESLGLVRHEIRHSAFIRWLLDPSETHGLGDYWLRQFLRQVIKQSGDIPGSVTLFDLDGWNLGQAEVRREWRNIDLLIVDDDHHFVCAIENKVGSGEGLDQLCRYRKIVESEFAGYKKTLVFLTIAGDAPSDDAYIPLSYRDIVRTIEIALQRRASQVNDEIKLFVQQYVDMLRRHIVEESEIQELCRKLYQNHRRALDLIFEHKPDRADEVSESIQDYVKSRDDLIPAGFSKNYIKFLPCSMDVLPRRGTGHQNNLMMALTLENKGERVRLRLELGPGPQQIRQQVYELSKSSPKLFGKPKTKLSPVWHSFLGCSETWINSKEYDDLDDEGFRQRIGEKIQSFLERKGDSVADALKALRFEER